MAKYRYKFVHFDISNLESEMQPENFVATLLDDEISKIKSHFNSFQQYQNV